MFSSAVSFKKKQIVARTGRESADCAGGESGSGKHRTESVRKIPEVWS